MSQEQPIVIKSRPTHAEQIVNRCVHFTGIYQQTCCKAGVKYDDVRKSHEPIPYRTDRDSRVAYDSVSFPCNTRLNLGGATCDKARFPTPEEVAKEEADSMAGIERMLKARASIVEHIKSGGPSSGVITCPNCGGMLGYSRAESNGHIWGNCRTAGCASWME